MEETTTAITAVKEEVRLRDWATQIEAQQASGMTVQKWCEENGSSPRPIIIICGSSVKSAWHLHRQSCRSVCLNAHQISISKRTACRSLYLQIFQRTL